MSVKWPLVKLGEVLSQYREYIEHPEFRIYPKLSVKLYGKGVVLDEPVDGTLLKMKRHQIARAGQVILSEIWGKKGAIGIVPQEGEGALCTSHFFLFDIYPTKIEGSYLKWLLHGNYLQEQLEIEARGTTGYAATRPKHLLSAEIPLPPLERQRRIVTRIEELAVKIEEVQRLRKRAVEETESFLSRARTELIDDNNWKKEKLGAILKENPKNGISPRKEVESGGRPILRINAVSSSLTRFVDLTIKKNVDVSDEEAEPFVLKNNDVFIVRYNGDINRVAKPAIYKTSDKCNTVFPDKLIRLRPEPSIMTPDFLVFALGSKSVRLQIEELGKTTAGNIGISGANIKSFIIPVPPLKNQHFIVNYLDKMQEKVDIIKRLQSETSAELAALLLSILDKAFKGEL